MSDPHPPRRRVRFLFFLISVGLLLGVAITAPAARHALLRAAGRALIVSNEATHADVIVISTDADGAGVLEAADLVRAGVAERVAIFPDPPDSVDREFIRRGVTYFDAAAVSETQLRALGVRSIERIPEAVAGTSDEGSALARWCQSQGLREVVFISTADHSRRTRRVLSRAMRDTRTQVIVRYSRYSEFDPDTWWQTSGGVRIQIVESEKLLLDLLRHPFS